MMPSKKKKYNARFPAGRIKKIMQTDDEVGKVAQAVPVIISRALELFVESLLTKAMEITNARNARTLTPSHMKQCIQSEQRFAFLKELVNNVPDMEASEDEGPPAPTVKYELTGRRGGGRGRGRGRRRGSEGGGVTPTTPSGGEFNFPASAGACRPPVIVHTGSSSSRTNNDTRSKDSDDEDEDDDNNMKKLNKDNGFCENNICNNTPLILDDDYDN